MTKRHLRSAVAHAPAWRTASPYLTGAAIGLLNVGTMAVFRKGIGVSGAYESSAALAARRVAPDALQVNSYVQARDKAPKFDWEFWLTVGTVAGGLLAARFERSGAAPVQQQDGDLAARSPLASAAGGALLMYGARMAGGCTSGHALSGTAQGGLSSWLFTPLMFVVGALVARRPSQSQQPVR